MNFEKDLTPKQLEAVNHIEGPLLVVAGAGSGKTRVITYRIANMINNGLLPSSILAITFTNKAAGEMRDRAHSMYSQDQLRGMWVTTFHSMCARILRVEAEHLGYSRDYTIYDAQDQERLVKGVMKEMDIDTTTFRPRAVLSKISNAKNELQTPETYQAPGVRMFAEVVEKVFAAYNEALKNANAMDFDDLLLLTAVLFRDHENVLRRYQERFGYVLIDEYQDTNHAQYVIARQLSKSHENICVTGDPDQSIYGWRGADIENILRFEDDFPGAKVVRLEENFRSTKNILAAADSLIKNNKKRKERDLFTNGEEGPKVRAVMAADEQAEAAYIAETIGERLDSGASPREFAVLYRANALSRNVESAMMEAGIPYTIVGSVAFYQRKEIKDILGYMRLVNNPADDVSFQRVVNVPPRKIGTKTVDKLRVAAREGGLPLFEAAKNADVRASLGAAGKKLEGFVYLVRAIIDAGTRPVKDLVEKILEVTKYREYLVKSEGPEADDRWENVEELVAAAAQFDDTYPDGDLQAFLEQVALVSDIDSWDDREDRVTLMTMHAAKGLEFPVVFVVGLEEGVFPSGQSLDDFARIEEERRLAYVGITRAMNELHLTRAFSRFHHGDRRCNRESRFLGEINPGSVEPVILFEPEEIPAPSFERSGGFGRKRGARRKQFYDDDGPSIDYDSGIRSDSGFSPGDVVLHRMFGQGVVKSLSGDGADTRISVVFRNYGEKKLMLRLAGLQKV